MLRSSKFGSRRLVSSKKREHALEHHQGWYPPALRWWSLALAVLFCWASIAALQYYLYQSQLHSGIIFAAKINDLPLRHSFWYLYLPTIIAVVFSVFVLWIDHDAKRYEPYRQLSQAGGALATNSILLRYPFDFAPIVPIMAAKRSHWLVFWASFAGVLTTFGIVPLQAGIFSTRPITRTSSQNFTVSDNFVHSSIQEQKLTSSYTQLVYGILELNETLPAFTTRNYTLKPFTNIDRKPHTKESWTASSILYSVNLQCESAQAIGTSNKTFAEQTYLLRLSNVTASDPEFTNSAGCKVSHVHSNNNTIGANIDPVSIVQYRKFSASYMGYFPSPNPALVRVWGCLKDQKFCGVQGNRTFFATFTQNKETELDPPSDITAIFCKPYYYEQDVKATVDAITGTPKNVDLVGNKRQISADIFNTTVFEETLALGILNLEGRGDSLPVITSPQYTESLYYTDLTPLKGAAMMAAVMSASKHRFPELKNPKALAEAYELVYQLFFACAMTEILNPDFSTETKVTNGLSQAKMEAVVLEPIFTYLVESLLALVSVAAIALMYIGYTEHGNQRLVDDPASMAYVMSLIADDDKLLDYFGDLDCASTQYFHQKLYASGYKIGSNVSKHAMTSVTIKSESQQSSLKSTIAKRPGRLQSSKPERPTEFRTITAVPFIGLFVALMIALAILFAKSQPYGLPLPSGSQIVQNLVSKYIPTAIATLIEPLWIMINRLLCVLQPLEQMRGLKAAVPQTITLKYSSLPPQLTIIKAAQGGHFVLAAVCGMSLLANLLATAFAGLFFSATTALPRPMLFSPPFQAKFVTIDESFTPLIPDDAGIVWDTGITNDPAAYRQGMSEDHFLLSDSNFTRNTSLPVWTDRKAFYVPFKRSEQLDQTAGSIYQARTKYFAAKPRCTSLTFGKDYRLKLWSDIFVPVEFAVTVLSSNGTQAKCTSDLESRSISNFGSQGMFSSSYARPPCHEGKMTAEIVINLVSWMNATMHEAETCATAVAIGWIRATHQYCDSSFHRGNGSSQAPPGFEDAASNNTFLMVCQPEIRIGDATVSVDSTGVLTEPATNITAVNNPDSQALNEYFSNGVANLTTVSNFYIFQSLISTWHSTTFASEFIHYFINKAASSARLTDPKEPPPTFADVEAPMNEAYSQLFAIWLSVNRERLFQAAINTTTTSPIPGTITTPKERLMFVTPLFIISETIIAIYILVSITVYIRRPGRYLARLPTSIAAVIALFASSAAVKDLRGTSHMMNKERDKYLRDLDCKYGYGSFVGGDGSVHVGIEKMPFVRYMKEVRFDGSRAARDTRRKKEGEEETGQATSVSSARATRGYASVPQTDIPIEDMLLEEERCLDASSALKNSTRLA